MQTKLRFLFVMLALLAGIHQAAAQGSAFTYQGRLWDGGLPANGTNYGMVFYLYDAPTNGTVLGNEGIASVTVSNGLFTLPLSFGNVFDGNLRWLEITVQNNGGGFTTLSPRQQLTPTPYAIMAGSASNLLGALPAAQLSGTISNSSLPANPNFSGTVTGNAFSGDGGGLTNLNAGQLNGRVADARLSANVALLNGNQTFAGTNRFSQPVGIGTTKPDGRPLAIEPLSGFEWISLKDTNGVTRWHLNNALGGLNFVQTLVADYRLFLGTNGNVGIGTSLPQSALQVVGTVTANAFSGDGSALTNLTVPASQIIGGFSWQIVSGTAQQAQPNTGYLMTNNALVTVTLPTNLNLGDLVRVSGVGSGGWQIAQNAGQSVLSRAIDITSIGAVWTARDTNRNWQPVASSADGTKLVAAEYGGHIFTSTDSGATWTPRDSSRNWISVASSTDGTKLIAGNLGGQLYTSTDSGVTWTARDNSRKWQSMASSADGTKLVAGVSNGQIYTSTDSGVTWTARDSSRKWQSMASSADGTKFVAVVYGGQIYTSSPSTTPGPAGYLLGNQNAALELQYVGNGQFLPLSFVGTIQRFNTISFGVML